MFTRTSAGGATYSEENVAEATDNSGEVRDDATDEFQQTTEQSHFNPRFSGFVVRPGGRPDFTVALSPKPPTADGRDLQRPSSSYGLKL